MDERNKIMATTPTTTVAAAAIMWPNWDHPTHLLCAQRSYPAHLAGKWELPGGKAEPGETIPAATQREIAEELGTAIALGPTINNPNHPAGQWPINPTTNLAVTAATIPNTATRPQLTPGPDHLQLQWIPIPTLTQLDWLPADTPIAQHIQDMNK